MINFFKSLFTTILGVFIAIFLMVFVGIGIIAGLVSNIEKPQKQINIKENTILHLSLNNGVKDRASNNPLKNFDIGTMESREAISLRDFTQAIEKAKSDTRIEGIYLDLTNPPAGMATMEEMRMALEDFKSSGKWIVSYAENYSQYTYYFASVADEIYMYPEGDLSLLGLRTELMFFKRALEKLEIEPQIIRGRNNKFKSAVEPFMYEGMSEANRAQISKIQNSMWSHLTKTLSTARGITNEQVNKLADSVLVQSGYDAMNYNLVDSIVYKDELLSILKNKVGLGLSDDIRTINLRKYCNVKLPGEKLDLELLRSKNNIAVVYAIGGIESGNGDDETIGSERISKAIRKARKDTTIKSIVLRVNSPGGSALASDVIWREIVLAKKVKPVVVSMGDVAASGGYYIACAADKIYAEPTTITGSIGVFGIIPNMKNFFTNKLGITFDRVKTNSHADMMTSSRPLDNFEYSSIQKSVERVYDDFISKVAAGRGMTKEAVDEIGQGRVWTGIDAKEIGLIDEFGGLEDAITEAASLAGLDKYKVVEYPKQKDPFDQLIVELQGGVSSMLLEFQLGENSRYYKQLQQVKEMRGIQARLPFAIDFQ